MPLAEDIFAPGDCLREFSPGWCNPPWSLILQVLWLISHSQGASAILVCPDLRGKPRWPLFDSMVVLRSLAQGPPASGPTGGPRGRSGGRSRLPDLRDCLRACHRYCGASSQEAEVLVGYIADSTLKRYRLPFKCLIQLSELGAVAE